MTALGTDKRFCVALLAGSLVWAACSSKPSRSQRPRDAGRRVEAVPSLRASGEKVFGLDVIEDAEAQIHEPTLRTYHIDARAEDVVAFYRAQIVGGTYRSIGRGGTFEGGRAPGVRPGGPVLRVNILPLGAARTLLRVREITIVDAGTVDAAARVEEYLRSMERAE